MPPIIAYCAAVSRAQGRRSSCRAPPPAGAPDRERLGAEYRGGGGRRRTVGADLRSHGSGRRGCGSAGVSGTCRVLPVFVGPRTPSLIARRKTTLRLCQSRSPH
jgi:hypothetical protein